MNNEYIRELFADKTIADVEQFIKEINDFYSYKEMVQQKLLIERLFKKELELGKELFNFTHSEKKYFVKRVVEYFSLINISFIHDYSSFDDSYLAKFLAKYFNGYFHKKQTFFVDNIAPVIQLNFTHRDQEFLLKTFREIVSYNSIDKKVSFDFSLVFPMELLHEIYLLILERKNTMEKCIKENKNYCFLCGWTFSYENRVCDCSLSIFESFKKQQLESHNPEIIKGEIK